MSVWEVPFLDSLSVEAHTALPVLHRIRAGFGLLVLFLLLLLQKGSRTADLSLNASILEMVQQVADVRVGGPLPGQS